MRNVGTWFSIVVVLSALGCGVSVSSIPSPEASEDIDLSFPFDDDLKVEINWTNGSLTVRVDDAETEISVRGSKKVTASTADEAELFLAGVGVELSISDEDQDTLVVVMDVPEVSTFARFEVNAEVTLPTGVPLTINHNDDDVTVIGNTQRTTITVDDADVVIDEQQGGQITIIADNGDVTVDADNSNLALTVDRGDADLSLKPPLNGTVSVTVVQGTASLAVDSSTDALMSLALSSGEFSIDLDRFDVSGLSVASDLVSATLGSGDGTLDVNVVNGAIVFGPR